MQALQEWVQLEHTHDISSEKRNVGNSEVQRTTYICLHHFHKTTLNWIIMLSVTTYSPRYKPIQQFPLKFCKDQWKQSMTSRLCIGRFSLLSKRPLVRFMVIRKSLIMNFRNGYKVCRHLTQVQLFNWWLNHTMSKILLTIVVQCSIVYSGHLPFALKYLNIASH